MTLSQLKLSMEDNNISVLRNEMQYFDNDVMLIYTLTTDK